MAGGFTLQAFLYFTGASFIQAGLTGFAFILGAIFTLSIGVGWAITVFHKNRPNN